MGEEGGGQLRPEPTGQRCLRDQWFAKASGDHFLWKGWSWLSCIQIVMMKEPGERPEGTGNLCPVGEGCSKQGNFLVFFFLFKHKGRRDVGRDGVPRVEVPCGPSIRWTKDGGWGWGKAGPCKGA